MTIFMDCSSQELTLWPDRRSQQRTGFFPLSVIVPMVHSSKSSKVSSRNQNYVNALQNIHISEVVL